MQKKLVKHVKRKIILWLAFLYGLQLIVVIYFSFPVATRYFKKYDITLKAYRGDSALGMIPLIGWMRYVAGDGKVVGINNGKIFGDTQYDVYECDADLKMVVFRDIGDKIEIEFPSAQPLYVKKALLERLQ